MPVSLLFPIILLMNALLSSALAAAQPTMTISSSIFPPFTNEANTGFEDRIIPEMFRRAGYHSDVRRLPGQRAITLTEEGYMDADFSLVKGITSQLKNLVQMNEPTFRRDFVVFSKNKNMSIEHWNSLKPYAVAFVNGWKILEWNIKNYKSLTKASNPRQLFKLLENDRVDAVVYARYSGLYLLQKMGFTDIAIVGKPLATKDMCVVLHKKHKQLVPRLDKILRDMKQDGFYQQAFDETIGPLLKQ